MGYYLEHNRALRLQSDLHQTWEGFRAQLLTWWLRLTTSTQIPPNPSEHCQHDPNTPTIYYVLPTTDGQRETISMQSGPRDRLPPGAQIVCGTCFNRSATPVRTQDCPYSPPASRTNL